MLNYEDYEEDFIEFVPIRKTKKNKMKPDNDRNLQKKNQKMRINEKRRGKEFRRNVFEKD